MKQHKIEIGGRRFGKIAKLKQQYIDYLKQNPSAWDKLKESIEFLKITKEDMKSKPRPTTIGDEPTPQH